MPSTTRRRSLKRVRQRNDEVMLVEVLTEIRVPPPRPRAAQSRLEAVITDRACATAVIRTELRHRRIAAVSPEKCDQAAARARRGSRGGRAPAFDAQAYRGRNVSGTSPWPSNGGVWPPDKLAITYRAAVTLCTILTWLRA